MSLKEHILNDVKSMENPQLLNQVFEYIQVMKHAESQMKPNHDRVMGFAGLLKDSDAKKISDTISREFNSIEGEW